MPRKSTINRFKGTPKASRSLLRSLPKSSIRSRKRKHIDSSSTENSLTKKFQRLSTSEKFPNQRPKVLPGGGVKLKYGEEDNDTVDEFDPIAQYFEAFAKGAPKTSSNKINDLNLPSKKALRKYAKDARSINIEPRRKLLAMYKTQWDKWMFLLGNGFNLLFTGFGSKKRVIEEFCMSKLNWGGLIVVNGFFKGMKVASILTGISEKVLKGKVTRGRDNFTHVTNICNHMDNSDSVVDCIFLVLHNMDSENLSSSESQYLLALLSSHPKIHIIGSIDHYNAELLWCTRTLELFCWFKCQTPTFEPYLEVMQECPEKDYLTETINDTTRMARGVNHVLESLTPSHVDILQALGEECIERVVDGLTFKEWLTISEEQMLATTDVQFRQKLEELVDHELVLKRKAKGDEELKYYIPQNVLQYLDLDS